MVGWVDRWIATWKMNRKVVGRCDDSGLKGARDSSDLRRDLSVSTVVGGHHELKATCLPPRPCLVYLSGQLLTLSIMSQCTGVTG